MRFTFILKVATFAACFGVSLPLTSADKEGATVGAGQTVIPNVIKYLTWITKFDSVSLDGVATRVSDDPAGPQFKMNFSVKEIDKQSLFLFDTQSKDNGDVWNALQCWDGKKRYEFDHDSAILSITATRVFERPTIGNPLIIPLERVFSMYDGALPVVSLVDARTKYLSDKKFVAFCENGFQAGQTPLTQFLVNAKKPDEKVEMTWSDTGERPVPTKIVSTNKKGTSTIEMSWVLSPGKRPMLLSFLISGANQAKNAGSHTTYTLSAMAWDGTPATELTFDLNRAKQIYDQDAQMVIDQ